MAPVPDADRAAARSSFYYSFLFLPRPKREAILAVYRFCRAVDDAADGPLPVDEKKRQLEEWRRELDRCYSGRPARPVTEALRVAVEAFGLSRGHFEELIRGAETDLEAVRYESFKELSRYCYRVAGTIGLLSIQIFGLDSGRHREYAVALGTAFQLTNILRDLKADAARGRIYLPLEDLRKFGYSEKELSDGIQDERFTALMRHQYERARSFYEQARDLLRPEDRGPLMAAEIMAAIYGSLLERIRASGYRVFGKPVAIPDHQKFWIALKTYLSIRLSPVLPKRP
jgi:phytoene synthase